MTSARIPRKSSSDSDSRSPRRMRIRAALEAQYQGLYPLQLRRELDAELDRLWTLAAPDPHRRAHIEIATPSAKSAPWRLLDDAFGNPEF